MFWLSSVSWPISELQSPCGTMQQGPASARVWSPSQSQISLIFSFFVRNPRNPNQSLVLWILGDPKDHYERRHYPSFYYITDWPLKDTDHFQRPDPTSSRNQAMPYYFFPFLSSPHHFLIARNRELKSCGPTYSYLSLDPLFFLLRCLSHSILTV